MSDQRNDKNRQDQQKNPRQNPNDPQGGYDKGRKNHDQDIEKGYNDKNHDIEKGFNKNR